LKSDEVVEKKIGRGKKRIKLPCHPEQITQYEEEWISVTCGKNAVVFWYIFKKGVEVCFSF
jgi:hypothetical protein